MSQQTIKESTNYMKMFELLAQASADNAKEQQPANHPVYQVDLPVLEAHIFLLLGID